MLSAKSERRSAAVVAPNAERTASSDSRRTVRASTRLATFEHAITNSRPEAANSTHKIVLARELIWSCMRVDIDFEMAPGLVHLRMCGQHGRVGRAQLRPRRVEIRARSEPGEHLGHAMFATGHHRGG